MVESYLTGQEPYSNAPWIKYGYIIERVIFQEGIKSVSGGAFLLTGSLKYTNLKHVKLSNTITKIGAGS